MSACSIKAMTSDAEITGKALVHYQAWQETYTGLVDQAYLDRMSPEKCTAIARQWPDNVLVAKDGDRVIGFTGYGPYRDDSLPGHGEVYALYVLAAYHGQPVGYELMNAALEKLTDYRKIAVWVLKDNLRAIRFYERYGFRFDGTEAEILLGTPRTELRMIYERP